MNTLPLDHARCKPVAPDDNCRNCKRWAELPGQTFGMHPHFVVTTNSRDRACIQVVISYLERDK